MTVNPKPLTILEAQKGNTVTRSRPSCPRDLLLSLGGHLKGEEGFTVKTGTPVGYLNKSGFSLRLKFIDNSGLGLNKCRLPGVLGQLSVDAQEQEQHLPVETTSLGAALMEASCKLSRR